VFVDESLGPISRAVEEADGQARSLTGRIRERDHTVWQSDPTEVADRLGWLDAPRAAQDLVSPLASFSSDVVSDGVTDVALVGMGGSSLFPEVLANTFGPAPGHPRLHVLDSTDPGAVLELEARLPWTATLVVAASKSGTTVEMRSLLSRFQARLEEGDPGHAGRSIAAITDPGTPLQSQGEEQRFRAVFSSPQDVGGRFSALTAFGLVPGALLGVDLEQLVEPARTVLDRALAGERDPGDPVRLGAVLAAAARAGRDKLTLLLPEDAPGLGAWIEQLVAESTGKHGVGILPVLGESADADRFEVDDRLVVALGDHPGVDAVADAGHPVVRLAWDGPRGLGAEIARWELAVAVAGALLEINPFDQPNVASAKKATEHVLSTGGDLPGHDDPRAALDRLRPGGYVALLGFVTPSGPDHAALLDAAERLRQRTPAPVTVGVGPRYLHSTGQLHKGGPDGGVFLVTVGEDPEDAEVPGEDFTFSRLKRAQAAGDLEALRGAGRHTAHVPSRVLSEL
jgi:glucose-6-phosphate isomerase